MTRYEYERIDVCTYEAHFHEAMMQRLNELGAQGYYVRHMYDNGCVLLCRAVRDEPRKVAEPTTRAKSKPAANAKQKQQPTSAADIFAGLGGV